jgi:hypothetical protein
MDEFSPDNPFANMNMMFGNDNKLAQNWEKQNKAKAATTQAGVAGAQPGMATAASAQTPSATNNSGLEARIAALEAGNNTPNSSASATASTPSSMAPGALAAGEAMFGTQQQRDTAVDPNIFNRRFN